MRTRVLFLTVTLAAGANCFANLITTDGTSGTNVGGNTVPSNGSGYGAVATLLNAQDKNGAGDDGLEANCNVFAAGIFSATCGAPFSSLSLNDPANQNNAVSLGTLFTTSSNIGSELLLIFNTNQTGPHTTAGEAINLDALGLAVWYNGSLIFSALRTTVDSYDTTLQGIGVAGFGYKLDTTEAGQLNTAITNAIGTGASLNTIFVTGAFEAGCLTGGPSGAYCANDGAETIFVAAQGPNVVPEPMSLALVGGGLLALGLFRKRFSA